MQPADAVESTSTDSSSVDAGQSSRPSRPLPRDPGVSGASSRLDHRDDDRQHANIKFADCEGFHRSLKQRVDEFFAQPGKQSRDMPRMYRKSFTILAWCLGSYLLLLFWSPTWWTTIPLAASLGLAMAAIGFNIQHDGGHSAYSRNRRVNQWMSYTMDLIGGSSYVWKHRHNVMHHTYTNITGHDGDVDLGALGRLTPHQTLLPFHRFQHLYLWALYGLVTVKWHFLDDFRSVIRGKVGELRMPRPKGKDLAVLLSGKVIFFCLAFLVPLIWFQWYTILAVYLLATFIQGVVMSVVFQLAHVMEDADFPMPEGDSNRMEAAWAVHQVQTTVNFAMQNPVVCWFTGGLNFQIEHHLLPHVCHLNYPELSAVVADVCREHGLDYHVHDTVSSAVKAHYLWLKEMGQPAPSAAA